MYKKMNLPIYFQFSQSSYEFSIDENNSPNSYLGQVIAYDDEVIQLRDRKVTYHYL